jgi:PHD/YefM family antitoxin component YafN of YafNO toxin-antitoxin module
MSVAEIQYISDESGNTIGVIIPIELWREIESERETAYLLKSENMKQRLLEAKDRQDGIPLEEAREKLGI